MLRLCLLALAALAAAQAAERCPIFASKTPFDPSKFAGQWHNYAYNKRADESGNYKCQKVNVVAAEVDGKTSLTYNYDYLENDKATKAVINAKTFRPGFPGLFLGVWKREDMTNFSDPYLTSILATDYDHYAVIVACAHLYDAEHNTFSASLYTQILSREKSLSDDTYHALTNILSGYGISEDTILKTNQADC